MCAQNEVCDLQRINKVIVSAAPQPEQSVVLQVRRGLMKIWREFCKTVFLQEKLSSFIEPMVQPFSPGYLSGFHRAKVVSVIPMFGGFLLRLKPRSPIDFRPGQHVQLRLQLDGRFIDRFFTITSSLTTLQHDGCIELAIRQKSQGLVSEWLSSGAAFGAEIWLGEVAGDFQLDQSRPALLLAAGSGITPFRAMLQSLSRLTQPIHLLHIVRQQEHAWFADEWSLICQKFPLLTVDVWSTQQRGRPDLNTLAAQVVAQQVDVYLCGPNPLQREMKTALAAFPHWQGRLVSETFGGSSSGDVIEAEFTKVSGETIKRIGQGSLLQLAEQAGIQPKFGCRRGVCMQCVCQKQQGQVRHQLTGELSGFGPEWVQLCVSEAVTPVTIKLSV